MRRESAAADGSAYDRGTPCSRPSSTAALISRGGHATRRNSVFSVMLLSQTAGILVALVAAPLVGPNAPGRRDFAWGLLAGITGSMGLGALYSGLAKHKAAIVSPVSALVGASSPRLSAPSSASGPRSWP